MFNVGKHITIATSLRMDARQISPSTHRQAFSDLLFVSLDALVGR
jgi:hypothetical protein